MDDASSAGVRPRRRLEAKSFSDTIKTPFRIEEFFEAPIATRDAAEVRVTGRLTVSDLKRSSTLPGLGAKELSPSEETRRELRLLESRSLVMRAAHASGLNIALRRRVRAEAERAAQPTTRASVEEIVVTHAAASDLLSGKHKYGLSFVSNTEYELWSGPHWLGVGTLGHPFVSERLRLRVARSAEQGDLTGAHYELELRPLHEVVTEAQRKLTVVAMSELSQGRYVHHVELSFTHASASTARAFLRQLVLAYLRLRPLHKPRELAPPAALSNAARPAAVIRPIASARSKTASKLAPPPRVAEPVVARRVVPAVLAPTPAPLGSMPQAPAIEFDFFGAEDVVARELATRLVVRPGQRRLRWVLAAALALGGGLVVQGTVAGRASSTKLVSLPPLAAPSANARVALPVPTVEPLRKSASSIATARVEPRAEVEHKKARAAERASSTRMPQRSGPRTEPAAPLENVFGPRDFDDEPDGLPGNPY